MDRAGLVGADGPTHAGSFDIAYLGTLPNFSSWPRPTKSNSCTWSPPPRRSTTGRAPCAIRAAKAGRLQRPPEGIPLAIGKGRVLREGTSIAILSYGTRLFEFHARGGETVRLRTIADRRRCALLQAARSGSVRRLAREHEVLITIEEGAIGGFGSHVMQFLAHEGLLDRGLKIRPMTLPDRFLDQDTPDKMYEAAGLDAKAIVQMALNALGREHEASAPAHIA